MDLTDRIPYSGRTLRTLGLLVLTAFLASCGSAEVVKEAKPSPAPPDPPEREAPVAAPVATEDARPTREERERAARADAAFFAWVEQVEPYCQRTGNPEGYLPLREGVTAEDTEIVKARCAKAAEIGLRGEAWRASLRACVDRFVKAKGKGTPPACRLAPKDVPKVPASLFDRHVAECSAACERAGPEEIALEKERSQPAWCCDGTRSACTYKNLKPSCCAGHGGVCIE